MAALQPNEAYWSQIIIILITIRILQGGPYLITGGINLGGDNVQWAEGSLKEHYVLCRRGASKNKPFCDGMHRLINFKDDDDQQVEIWSSANDQEHL